ncbi:MAG: hypothetical protein IJ880_10575 [Bacilli bacterium]|nr:hypothetical protein [Bacilli bacterium]
MDMRCLTDEESELYEKSLNEEATETGINLFTVKSFTPTVKTNRFYASPFIDKTAEATGRKSKNRFLCDKDKMPENKPN